MLPNKKVLAAIVLAAGVFVLVGAGAQAATISSDEAHQLVKKGALLLDVRTPGEFADGHIDGAVNIPVDEVSAAQSRLPAKKDSPIVVYCRSGHRSAMAKAMLEKAGYTKVSDLGSITNWK